jgi:orotate phosphoribosyltransferase-like protein
MKVYLEYEDFKKICIQIADSLPKDITCIVCVVRGGVSAGHIISKHLKLEMGFYYPSSDQLVLPPGNKTHRLAIVEDLVAKGRTYNCIVNSKSLKNYPWIFAPVLIDDSTDLDFKHCGFRSSNWVVFPYEDYDKMNEGDRGLFRERSDSYGQ